MDEAEKYQQRLQAIAEKRRLQEEQERVKREMEEEKMRLQQMKRKSLRDQWLMDGPPLSPDPTAPPHSPLWGSQAQDIQHNIDNLQAKAERLTEEVDKIREDGHSEDALNVKDGKMNDEACKEAILQNGDGNRATEEAAAEGDLKGISVSLAISNEQGPNGELTADVPILEAKAAGDPADTVSMETSASVSKATEEGAGAQEAIQTSNGQALKLAGGNGSVTMTFLGFSDAAGVEAQGVNLGGEDDEDDAGAIIRAERVVIVDEGEDEEEGEEEDKSIDYKDTLPALVLNLSNPVEPTEGTVVASELPPSSSVLTLEASARGPDPEGQGPDQLLAAEAVEVTDQMEEEKKEPITADQEKEEEANTVEEKQDEETEAKATATPSCTESASDPAEVQSLAAPTDVAVASSEVPVYSPVPQASISAIPDQDGGQTVASKQNKVEVEEAVLEVTTTMAQAPAPAPTSPSQFEEVALDGGEGETTTLKSHVEQQVEREQEPLLVAKGDTQTDMSSAPQRVDRSVGDNPKQKTCQCCSLM